jgi:N-methylhydantoinase B/oxoprolinase/acetone carboxylase alpha subunit
VIHRADGREEPIPSKLVTELQRGDRVVLETAGGGGHGDPARRAPDQVQSDLANGKISAEGASIYPQPQTLRPATDPE